MTYDNHPHPFDDLSIEEIYLASSIIRKEHGNIGYIFSSISLKEPAKDIMLCYLGWENASKKPLIIDREALVILVDRPSGLVHQVTINLSKQYIMQWKKLHGVQPTLHPDEMMEAEQMILQDPGVIDQCKQLGIDDMKMVFADTWGIGWQDTIKNKRLIQAFMYIRTSPNDNQYAHPLDFVPIYGKIDIIKRRNGKQERPSIPLGNHPFLPEQLGYENLRKDIKPIEIRQPEGVSFTIRGQEIDWQKWNMHIGFSYREGLVIRNVNYRDMDGTVRPILYRMALAEMVVPYGNPYDPHIRKMAFDVGEYGLGYQTNSLELGCDCVGSIHYMDAMLNDMKGDPWYIPNAICIHEEDAGLLFKHTDYRNGKAHVVRSRRLVISHIVTVANYDYGLYYYFYQDGTIQFEVKATGELNTHVLAHDEDAAPYGTIVAPQIDAQHHQHLFNMRIDPMLDGTHNSVAELDVVVSDLPVGHPDNKVGNSFYPITKIFNTTNEAQSMACGERNRTWKIINESKIHPWAKQPVGFKMVLQGNSTMLPKPGSVVYERAQFASKSLWVTCYDQDQMFPGGFYCCQSKPNANLGLPQWTQETQTVRNKDIVCWFTFGLTHIPRVEDFPIMPTETCGWTLKPVNFFLGNPAIDVPPSEKSSTNSQHADVSCCRTRNTRSKLQRL
ncbi:hypothetical protein K492DRAFT_217507 [Lichtheimia hyalospora FSU 10163]|nr:hypothetical protein K492DRAFT_217507 [Lichtheimia hyalospora FSU 10163]